MALTMNESEPKNQNEPARKKIRGLNYACFCPIVFILGVIVLLTRYILCYSCGYYQTSFTPMGYNYLLALFGLFLFLALFVVWIESLFRRQQRVWTTIAFAGLLALACLKYLTFWPHDMVRYGLRNGMLQHYGVDEMRRFAADFEKLPRRPDTISGYDKFYDNRPGVDELVGTGLKEKYPFLVRCEFMRKIGNTVCVNWGGFDNHWGFCVTTDGKPSEPNTGWASGKSLFVGDDIYFFSEY